MKALKKTIAAAVAALGIAAASSAVAGPVILMGIDAEDGGVGGHGPIAVYQSVVNSLIGGVTNGGTNILVIGGGKAGGDNVTTFWNAVDGGVAGHTVTYVNGAANITAQSFAGFAAIAIASSFSETPSGGLSQLESNALNGRAVDIAAFVNAGGGLFGLSQTGLTTPYGYLGNVGAFTSAQVSYQDITPTGDGTAIGITNSLDLCCWHDVYLTYPAFLSVLATRTGTTQAAAIGGATVQITIPEPGTLALLGLGLLAGLAGLRRKVDAS